MNNVLKYYILFPFHLMYKIQPELTLRLLFRLKMGEKLELDNPKTYNQQLQWIKLYDKNPLMPKCCDKFHVRDYVTECGCGEILNELYWEGFSPEEIPFDSLPDQFVIKVTHGSTFNIICKNKENLNRKDVITCLKKWMKIKFLPCYGEWFYGVLRPRIIIEKFLSEDGVNSPSDYKVLCWNGEPRYIRVDYDRAISHKANFYDLQWNFIEGVRMKYPNSNIHVTKPEKLDEMLEYARKLSKNFRHCRVDFYYVNNKIYFGELTFTMAAGYDKITPHSFDLEMGSWMNQLCSATLNVTNSNFR